MSKGQVGVGPPATKRWNIVFHEVFMLIPHKTENTMDKNRIAGSAKQVGGAIKETAGKVTGDTKLQTEGSAQKAAGKVQTPFGGAEKMPRPRRIEIVTVAQLR